MEIEKIALKIAERHYSSKPTAEVDETYRLKMIETLKVQITDEFKKAQPLQLLENAVSSCSWIDAVFHHPITYKTGNFDGKNSDLVLVKDACGKIYIGYMNECIMDGSHTKDWYDQNDFEIKKVVEWTKVPTE
jgi:hypothetical protein